MKIFVACVVSCVLGSDDSDEQSLLQHKHSIEGGDSGPPLTFDALSREYPDFISLPLSEAQLSNKGWLKQPTACDPRMGYLWTKDVSTFDFDEPLAIYTDEVGELSGVAIMVRGQLQASENERWFRPIPSHLCPSSGKVTCDQSPDNSAPRRNGHFLEVAFRNGQACSTGATKPTDQFTFTQDLVVNPDVSGKSFVIPLSEVDAAQSGWVRGSCFDTMGWHYGKEDRTDGKLSFSARELYPVVPMYWNDQVPDSLGQGNLRAFFFTVPGEQGTISTDKTWYKWFNAVSPLPMMNPNGWDGRALSAKSMSFNFCDRSDFDFTNTGQSKMSTMHIFGGDSMKVQCDSTVLKCVTMGIPAYIPSTKVQQMGDIGCCPP